MKKIFFTIIVLFFSLVPVICVSGSGDVTTVTGLENPLKADTFEEIFISISNWIAGIVATVAVLMIVYGGFQYMFSQGKEEEMIKARKTIQWAVIGLIVVGMARGLLTVILKILEVS